MVFKSILSILFVSCASAGSPIDEERVLAGSGKQVLRLGNERMELYLPLLKGKKTGLVGNQSSIVGKTHLADTLLASGINITAVFSPEHGFRGDADAGESVKSGKDAKTGLPIYSLYGNNKKPSAEQLKGIEVMLFDIQDVGVRFYTYISTLHYVMEACAENGISLIVLDKPNPNGHYVDGPLREEKWKSFVGMHPVPIVHGMTIGEYAQMINGEKWLTNGIQCDLKVIACENYTHTTPYRLPVAPSPNLRSMASIYLYPSLCLFEGTSVSVGRGTKMPFEVYGHPDFPKTNFSFTPVSGSGAKDPLWKDKVCNGYLLSKDSTALDQHHFHLSYLIIAKNNLEKAGVPFITSANFFDKLAGTSSLREQLLAGKSETEIRESWKEGLENFKKVRAKYLIYE
ncbi:MAG: hypothetical protein BGO87_01355 [Flavobacteriia bacterium 40-80]|nr:MAG: hypothetical protein BGO87_01355 [Flavobacteriia bacterium 40-80]